MGWFGSSPSSNRRSGSPARSTRSSKSHSRPTGAFVRDVSPRRKHSSSTGAFVRSSSPRRSKSEGVSIVRAGSPIRHKSGVENLLGLGGGRNSPKPVAELLGLGREDRRHSNCRSYSPAPSMARSIFGIGEKHHSSSSYYKRSPREGFIQRIIQVIKRLLRDLIRYARNNPVKLITLVILPLVSGGALATILAKFGIRIPSALQGMMGANKGRPGGGMGASFGGMGMGSEFGRAVGGGGIGGSGIGISEVMGVAKMFI